MTTRAIVIEICNALSKENLRKSAVELIDSMEAAETISIISISDRFTKMHSIYFAPALTRNGVLRIESHL